MSLGELTDEHDYTSWYRFAEEVLGPLIPHLTSEEIAELVAKRSNWFPIPLASESNIGDVANRNLPHVDFKLLIDGTIRIGMRCNTIQSVEKMANVLDSLQCKEKIELLSEMQKLDGDFKTEVLAKIKETNFAHIDRYDSNFQMVSNLIDEKTIDRIFETANAIRSKGIARMKSEGLTLNPETPILDICFVTVKQDPALFKHKLSQMKRIYEICLSVKTSTELRKERTKRRNLSRKRQRIRRPKLSPAMMARALRG